MLRGRWSKLFVPVAITALLGSACRGSADIGGTHSGPVRLELPPSRS